MKEVTVYFVGGSHTTFYTDDENIVSELTSDKYYSDAAGSTGYHGKLWFDAKDCCGHDMKVMIVPRQVCSITVE